MYLKAPQLIVSALIFLALKLKKEIITITVCGEFSIVLMQNLYVGVKGVQTRLEENPEKTSPHIPRL